VCRRLLSDRWQALDGFTRDPGRAGLRPPPAPHIPGAEDGARARARGRARAAARARCRDATAIRCGERRRGSSAAPRRAVSSAPGPPPQART